MNLELLQLPSKSSVDSSKNSISSLDHQSDSLAESAGNGEFLQQLQQEFKNYEREVTEQNLPVNGNNLPSKEGIDENLSQIKRLNQEESELLSDELINLNTVSASALPSPVQPVMAPLDVKANQQQIVLSRSIDMQLKSSEATNNDEAYSPLLDEEATEVTSELILPELDRKKQVMLDAQVSDVKSNRGDATVVMSSMTSNLSLSPKPTESTLNLNASLESPVSDHAAWGDELSNRMAWMVRQDIKVVNLRLNPVDLGPVEIRIQIKNEQVDVHFNSTHAQVREAIEVTVPRLRDMFGEQFLRLDNVNVSQHSFENQKGQSRDHDGGDFSGSGRRDDESESEDEPISALSNSAFIERGRIDYFV